jgi:RHS repeat-associated protein
MYKILLKVYRMLARSAAFGLAIMSLSFPANSQPSQPGSVSTCPGGNAAPPAIVVTSNPTSAQIQISVTVPQLDANSLSAQVIMLNPQVGANLVMVDMFGKSGMGASCGKVQVGPLPDGNYEIDLSVFKDSCCWTLLKTYNYTVANRPPVVTVDPYLYGIVDDFTALPGRVTDDQLPTGAGLGITWTKVSGPGNVAFGDATKASTTARFDRPGVYTVRLTATDTQYTSIKETQIAVKPRDAVSLKYDFAETQPIGETPISYSVTADGAAQVTIPLWVPPGRQGLQPSLALSYSSRNGNGPLGVGWQLGGLSAIMTCRRAPALDGAFGGQYPDKFCLDGQRLVLLGTGAGGEYRTEVESYRKIIAHGPSDSPDSFDVYQPDGLIFRYASRVSSDPMIAGSNAMLDGIIYSCTWGKTADVHGGCAVAGVQRRAWMLDKVDDRFGNSIEIDYNSSERLLPAELRYTYHSTASAIKKVVFEYESRPDARHFSIDGIDYTAKRRLKTINVIGPVTLADSTYALPSALLRRYDLAYTVHPVTAKSMLTQVRECAVVTPKPRFPILLTPGPCKSPLNFAYSGDSITFDDKTFNFVPGNGTGLNGFRTADVNGDGFDDLLYRMVGAGPAAQSTWDYRLSDGQKFGNEKLTGISAAPDTAELGAVFVNLDRNDTVDALIPTPTSYEIGLGNTDGTFTVSNLDTFFDPTGMPRLNRVVGIGDLNGDGFPDLFLRDNCFPSLAGTWCRWATALNVSQSGSMSFGMKAMHFRWSDDPCTPVPTDPTGQVTNCPQTQPGDPAFVVDIDGNGQNELIVPIRKLATELVGRNPNNSYSLEMRALSFPIGTSSTVKRSGLSSKQTARYFVDVNGDGLADAVQFDAETKLLSVAMNVGGSYGAPVTAPVSAKAIAALARPNNVRVGDFNDDGLEDLYLVSADILLQSDGELGFVEKSLQLPVGDDSCLSADCPAYTHRQWDQTLDFNGDGLADFVQVRDGKTHVLQRVGPQAGLLQQITGGPMTPEIRFVYKSTPNVHTAATCSYPQNCLRKGMWLVSEFGVKADVTDKTYPAGFNTLQYRYSGGRFDVRGGWLGFASRTIVDDQTGTTTTTTYDNTTRQPDPTSSAYHYPGAFRPVQEVIQVNARTANENVGKVWQSTTDYKYQDQIDPGCQSPCVLHSIVSEVRVGQAEATAQGQNTGAFTPVKSRRDTFAYNLYGLVTDQVTETFEGGFSADGTLPVAAKVKKLEIKRTPIQPDPDNWLVRRYDRITTTSTEPARAPVAASPTEPARPDVPEQIVARTTLYSWQPGTTAISRMEVEPSDHPDPTLHNITNFLRDPTGNTKEVRTQANDGNGQTMRSLQIAWDTLDQTFPRQITHPGIHCLPQAVVVKPHICHDVVQQAENYFYHAGLGLLAAHADPNGLWTTMQFDRFGRMHKIDVPSSADISLDYAILPTGLMTIISTRGSGETSREFVNMWGRTVRSESSRLNDDMAIVESSYDRLNQLTKRTFPHYEQPDTPVAPGKPMRFSPPVTYMEFTYDHLGRIRSRSIVAGTVLPGHAAQPETETWSYEGLVERHTNARGIQSTVESDAAGRIVRSAALAPPLHLAARVPAVPSLQQRQAVIRHEYGPFGVLDATTDRSGNRIQNHYDTLGRLTDTTDPSSGHSTVKFNGYGEPVLIVSGTGVSTTLEHDALGRVWSAMHTDPAQNATSTDSFDWDTAVNGLGKLADATSADGIKTIYEYDSLGRLSRRTWEVAPNQSYTLEMVWDTFDRPQFFKYPAVGSKQLVLEYHYQPQGALYGMTNQTSNDTYWKLLKQGASGIVLKEQLGASIVSMRTLDSRQRLSSITTMLTPPGTTNSPVPIQEVSYEYGPGGLISTRHNVPDSDNSTESFDYDFLGRLWQWTVQQKGTTSKQTYGYDDLGNLQSVSADSGAGRTFTSKYGPNPTSPNAGPYAVWETDENGASTVFQYDGGGRQTTGRGTTITWNYFDLPSRIQSASQDISYRYDPAHARTVKQGRTEAITYIGGAYERHVDSSGEKHVFNLMIPARMIGQVTWSKADDLSFFSLDKVGTPETIYTSSSATAVEKVEYDPFGERRNPSALATPASLPSSRTIGFTGHEADDEFGLINMNGRIYDPQTARFLTPDPIVQAPFSSQSWNRYSYVYNNPVNFIDPSGFQCEDAPNCISNPGGGNGNPNGGGGGAGGGYQCGSGNPFECFFQDIGNLFKGGTSSPNTPSQPPAPAASQQTPTRADATRQGADAGTGWGNAGGNSVQRCVGEICNSGNISEWNSYPSETPLSSPPLVPADTPDAPLADSPKRGWSGGFSFEISTINLFASGGGGAYGINPQYVPGYGWDLYLYGTPNDKASSGWAPGISLTGNLAYGEGAYTGLFKSAQGGLGLFSFSQFNSPLEGPDLGYYGISFGPGYSPTFGGLGTTTTNYVSATSLLGELTNDAINFFSPILSQGPPGYFGPPGSYGYHAH